MNPNRIRKLRRGLAALAGGALAVLAVLAGPRLDRPLPASADNLLQWEGVRPPYAPAIGTAAPYVSLAKFGAADDLAAVSLPRAHPIVVATNGDVFTAGRAGAGQRPVVYKSNDGGRSWNQSSPTSGIPTGTVVTALAIAPKYPVDNIIFAAFSDGAASIAGNGLAISTDGGAGFAVLADFSAGGGPFSMATPPGNALPVRDGVPFNVTALAISPDFDANAGTGLVMIAGNAVGGANGNDAVYQFDLNSGGGVNTATGTATRPVRWSGGVAFTGGAVNSLALAFSPQYPTDGAVGLLYSCAGSGSGRCGAGSGTFVARTVGGVFAGAGGGEISASERLGAAGFVATTGGLAFPVSYAGDAFYAAAGNGAASGVGDIFRFDPGGWTALGRAGEFSSLAVAGGGAGLRLLAAVESAGQTPGANLVYRSADAGQNFTSALLDGVGSQSVSGGVNRLALAPDYLTSGVAYGTLPGAFGGVVRTADYGASWADTGLTNELFNQVSAIVSFSSGAPGGYLAMTDGTNLSLWHTAQVGPSAAWTRLHRAAGTAISYVAPPDVPTAKTLYAFNTQAATAMIIKSADGGKTWNPVADPFTDARVTVLDADSATRLLAGDSAGRVWNSIDGGASWTRSPATLGQRVTGIRRLPQFASAGVVAVAAIVGSSPEVFVSADGGVTFAQVGGSQSAWGQTASSTKGLTVSNDGQYAANKTLYVRCDTCSDTDIWRITPNPAAPGAFLVERLGVPVNLRPLGHHTLLDAPGVAGGAALYLLGADPSKPDPGADAAACRDASTATLCTGSAMQWRTFSPAAMTPAAWSSLAAKSPPVEFPGQNASARLSGAVSDVLAQGGATTWWYGANNPASGEAKADAITQIVSITWPGEFLTPVSLMAPAAGAVAATNADSRGNPVALAWQPAGRAQCYDVQLAGDSAFAQLLVDGTAMPTACPPATAGIAANPSLMLVASGANSTSSTVLPLIEGASYSWRVRVRSVGLTAPGSLSQGPWSLTRSFVVSAQSRLTATPGSGAAGTGLTLDGAFFTPGETVEVRWDNPDTLLGAPAASPTGAFSLSVAVPNAAPAGAHIVRATGVGSGKTAAAGFTLGTPTPPGTLIVRGKVLLQVMGAPATDPNENRWANYPLSLTFSQAGSGVPVWAATVTTDREGAFTLTGAGFAAGVYDVTVKGAHTLSNKKVGLALPQTAGASPMDFGTLRAGDLSNDDRMGADDYSVLVTNFALQQGPITLATVGDAAPHPVRLSLSPGPEQVEAGDAFTLDIIMDAGAQPVDSVSATLHFPPHLLQAVNPAGAEVNRLERSAALPVTLANQVDNHAGSVEFAAGRLPDADPLSGDVTVATVYFKALARLSAPLPVTLVPNGAIASAAYYQGRALTER